MVATLFIITTTYFCLYVAAVFKQMIGYLIDNTDLELLEKFTLADNSIHALSLAEEWLSGNGNGLLYIFGDGIVVWRAWAVWSGQQSVIILPTLTLLATFATFLTACVIETITSTASTIESGTIAALLAAASVLSIATNLIAVLLIGFKTYQHWKFMKDTLGVGTSATGKVLMFLTESGIVYVIFQIINFSMSVVDTTDGTPLDEATNIFTVIMIIFSAAYPSLVILIVYNQHSIAQLTEGSTAGTRNLGTRISFARSPQRRTTATDSIMIRSQADNGLQASVARSTEAVPDV
ncbi:hypothetical protein C8J56DRAFT_1049848 [Mycena floridula]|nr:hypothetical protein C8J56DRAFT_1049848 [Mycena floridula]